MKSKDHALFHTMTHQSYESYPISSEVLRGIQNICRVFWLFLSSSDVLWFFQEIHLQIFDGIFSPLYFKQNECHVPALYCSDLFKSPCSLTSFHLLIRLI